MFSGLNDEDGYNGRRRDILEEIAQLRLNDKEREICEKVAEYFATASYKECSEQLEKILLNRPNDYRIKHNLIITQFLGSDRKDTEQLHMQLYNITKEANISINNLDADDIKNPVILYNIAVLYYHHKHYEESLGIISKVFTALSNLINAFSKRVKLLYIDLLLKRQLFDRALIEIELFESQLKVNEVASGEETTSDSSSPTPSSSSNVIVANTDLSPSSQETTKLSQFEKSFDQKMKTKLQIFKIYCLLSLKSLRTAKKEYKQLMMNLEQSVTTNLTQQQHNNITSLYLKAYYEYLRGNFKKCYKIISNLPNEDSLKLFSETGDLLEMINNTNLACCHFYLGRPTVSAVFFQKACFEAESDLVKDKRKLPISLKSYDRQNEILYNFGLSLLYAKHYEEAFNALTSATRVYDKNPRLWLRIAESCIQLYKSSNENDFSTLVKQTRLLEIDDYSDIEDERRRYIGDKIREENPKPVPTLYYAIYCVDKALKLINLETVTNEVCVICEPSPNPITNMQEIYALYAAILCAGSFIALTLGLYNKAIRYSVQLVNIDSNIPRGYSFLGKQYMAEALFYLGEREEASLTLADNSNCDLNFYCNPSIDSDDRSQENGEPPVTFCPNSNNSKPINEWFPKEEESSKIIFAYNRAITFTLKNDHDSADDILRMIRLYGDIDGNLLPNDFLKLEAYVRSKLGNKRK